MAEGPCSDWEPLPESALPAQPNHQPLRRPRSTHIEQPRFLALVFTLGGRAPGPHQRHHRELQPFADVQRATGSGLAFCPHSP